MSYNYNMKWPLFVEIQNYKHTKAFYLYTKASDPFTIPWAVCPGDVSLKIVERGNG